MKPLFLAALLLASTADAQAQKWEYAQLAFNKAKSIDGKDLRYWLSWSESIKSVEFKSWAPGEGSSAKDSNDFLSRVSGFSGTFGPGELYFTGFQNSLGGNGWELITLDRKTENNETYAGIKEILNTTTFWYKRLVGK